MRSSGPAREQSRAIKAELRVELCGLSSHDFLSGPAHQHHPTKALESWGGDRARPSSCGFRDQRVRAYFGAHRHEWVRARISVIPNQLARRPDEAVTLYLCACAVVHGQIPVKWSLTLTLRPSLGLLY